MKLLFNKSSNGAEELQQLTGSYYENNEFERIKTDCLLSQEKIQDLVGKEVIQRALDFYHSDDFDLEDYSGSSSEELQLNKDLVQYLQIPIAYLATIRYYESNLVSHEDGGRKVKIDNENEKMAWEWMLDRDDAAQLLKANETIDRLVRFLEVSQINEWLTSTNRKLTRKLFINSVELFHQSYPIDNSSRFFYTITPFLQEVQNRAIKKALGDTKFNELLAYWQNFNSVDGSGSGSSGLPGDETDEGLEELLQSVQLVMPLLAMIIAAKRLTLQVLPDSVVQKFHSMMQSRGASQVALPAVVKAFCDDLQEDATYLLDDIKRHLHASDPDSLDYQMLPNNDETNKFFSI